MTECSFTNAGNHYEIYAPDAKYYRVTRNGETVADYSGLNAWSIENGWNWRDVCHLTGAAMTSAQNAYLRRLALREAATYDRFMAENAGVDE